MHCIIGELKRAATLVRSGYVVLALDIPIRHRLDIIFWGKNRKAVIWEIPYPFLRNFCYEMDQPLGITRSQANDSIDIVLANEGRHAIQKIGECISKAIMNSVRVGRW